MEDWISSLKSVQSREHYEVRPDPFPVLYSNRSTACVRAREKEGENKRGGMERGGRRELGKGEEMEWEGERWYAGCCRKQ